MQISQKRQNPTCCAVQLEAKKCVSPFNGVSGDSAFDAAHLEFKLVDQPIVSTKGSGSDLTKPLNEVQITGLMTAGLWLANLSAQHSMQCTMDDTMTR